MTHSIIPRYGVLRTPWVTSGTPMKSLSVAITLNAQGTPDFQVGTLTLVLSNVLRKRHCCLLRCYRQHHASTKDLQSDFAIDRGASLQQDCKFHRPINRLEAQLSMHVFLIEISNLELLQRQQMWRRKWKKGFE